MIKRRVELAGGETKDSHIKKDIVAVRFSCSVSSSYLHYHRSRNHL
jgi:hypothetical protein